MYECIEMFKNGHMSVTDAEHLGRPTTATTTAQKEERARELNLQDIKVMINKLAKQLNISIVSACSVVYDNLQFHKVWAGGHLKN
jgi:hypothetical protein